LRSSGVFHNGIRFLKRAVINNMPLALRGGRYVFPQLVNIRYTFLCNLRCQQCRDWALKNVEELGLDEWKSAILNIKEYIGPYFIRFYGGEPFLNSYFIELLDFCFRLNIGTSITTNGTLIDENVARVLVSKHVMQLNISLDGFKPETHDRLRGVPGTYDLVMRSIECTRTLIPVQINTTIIDDNVDELAELAVFAKQKGITISFQGLINSNRSTGFDKTPSLFPKDLHKLDIAIDRLCEMKKNNSYIINSRAQLLRLKQYYHCSPLLSKKSCEMNYGQIWIKPRGDVYLCTFRDSIGNINQKPIKTIWEAKETLRAIQELKSCPYTHCLIMCGCHKENYGEFFSKMRRLFF